MKRVKTLLSILSLASLVTVLFISASGRSTSNIAAGSTAQSSLRDLVGTWSGTFQSAQTETSPFTMTIEIAPDSEGRLVGNASPAADCFKDTALQVMVNGATVVLSGSDPEGNNVTFRGGFDSSRTLLKMHYAVNGSASARCESDEGEGTLGKR
jgi:hypothetical protein